MIKVLKNLTKTEVILAFFVLLFTCTQTFLDLRLPDYMSEITLLVQTEGSAIEEVYIAGAKMLACAFGSLAIAVVVAIIAARIASNFAYITRGKVFHKVMEFSMQEVNSFSTASLITRTTNDITQVQMLIVMGMQMLIKAPITAVWAIIKISDKNSAWTVVTAIAVLVLLTIVSICLSLAVPRFKILQQLTDNINRVAREQLDGLNVVRAYNAEEYQMNKFEKANLELTKTNLFTARTMSFLMPSIQMISNGLVLGVYLVGAVIINEAVGMERITLFSDMVVFSAYGMQVVMAFMMLVIVFMLLPRASVAAGRINEVLETPLTIQNGTKTSGLNGKVGEVEFRNVSFKYPDAEDYVLHNISFTAKQGEVVALIGATGSGKSTIINLVPRFYDATQGEVLINGINVKEYSQNALNNLIGYVSQRATLFSGTIETNVTYGDNGKEQELVLEMDKAVETAQAGDFVNNFHEKYQAHVAQGGRNLSGGQKQRLSIARAIYRDPEIFIFDDSFSALDYKTDQKLRHALQEECKNTTRLIVGQRIGTIRDADQIIVIEDGEVAGMGKHQELLQNCEVYKQIALSQLSEEELV
ncbi:MAG: ABC transporter ATP-binding protein [Eubacteriales bacterium]